MSNHQAIDELTELPILRSWASKPRVPRSEVSSFCSALEDVVATNLGGYFYWPPKNRKSGVTKCRYDWFMRLGAEKYGLRLVIVFDVGASDVQSLAIHLLPGKRTQQVDNLVTERIEQRAKSEIERVLADAKGIQDGTKLKDYFPILYIKWPLNWSMDRDQFNRHGAIYASAYNAKTREHISAVTLTTRAYSEPAALARLTPSIDKLVALLSLLCKESVRIENVDLLKNRKHKAVWELLPKSTDVYATTRYKRPNSRSQTSGQNDAAEVARLALKLLSDSEIDKDEVLWRAIYAFVSGQELQAKHSTLSSIAFVAALAAFSKTELCSGTVTCADCGARPPHQNKGEVDGMTDHAASTLHLGPDDRQEVRNLLRDVHSRQRSSYVHDAVLRHAEIKDSPVSMARPTDTAPATELLKFKEDLHNLVRLVRRNLLERLCQRCPEASSLADQESEVPIMLRTIMDSAITVSNRAIGITMVPS